MKSTIYCFVHDFHFHPCQNVIVTSIDITFDYTSLSYVSPRKKYIEYNI